MNKDSTCVDNIVPLQKGVSSSINDSISLVTQDDELISVIGDLQNSVDDIQDIRNIEFDSYEGRIKGNFCSETVFNLSKRDLTNTEIKVLDKGLDFAPIQNKINEPELRKDFESFARLMRIRWHFRNHADNNSNTQEKHTPKSAWKPPLAHPNVEVFLKEIEKELLKIPKKSLPYSNLSKSEWQAVRSLADDRNLVIKKADKGSCVVVWDRDDYLLEASQQLENVSVYRNIVFKDRLLVNLVDTSNTMFRNLCRKGLISNKQLKYFTYEFKNATNLGKLYFLPKIHKKLRNVPGRPVISNCGTPTEKASEFLDHNLKSLMQSGKSYIKDTNDFLDKVRKLKNLPSNSILVTADVVGLYPSIPHDSGLEALEKALESRNQKIIPTEDLIEMASFVLKNNFFEFNDVVMQQISGTAIGTKFAPPYACIFMDQIESDFLKTQSLQPLVWLRYIDDIFFIWTHGGESLELFMNDLNGYHNNLKFTYETDKESVIFLDLCVKLQNGKIISDMHVKDTDRHQYLHYN